MGRIQEFAALSKISKIQDITTVAHVANTYTLDVQNESICNFKITSADANAKTIALSNVKTDASLISVSILIICTTAASFTYPANTTFAAGTPSFTTGQSYWITLESIDGGTTWAGYSVRRT